MKTLLSIILITLTLSACGTQSTEPAQQSSESTLVTSQPTERYTYEVSSINNQDITGKAIDNVSESNQGIYLTSTDLSFNVSTGDKIIVTYGEYGDDIESIEKAIQSEDGSYVPESFYK